MFYQSELQLINTEQCTLNEASMQFKLSSPVIFWIYTAELGRPDSAQLSLVV